MTCLAPTFEATAAPCAAQFHVLELLPITRSLKLLLTRLVKMSLQDNICTHVPKNNSVQTADIQDGPQEMERN